MKHFYLFAALLCGFLSMGQTLDCHEWHTKDTIWSGDGNDREVPRLKITLPLCGTADMPLLVLDTDNRSEVKHIQSLNTHLLPYAKTVDVNTGLALKMPLTATTTNVPEGANLYWTQARYNSAFAGKTTSDLTEGTRLYFTDARARSAITLTTTGSGAATYIGGVLNVPTPKVAVPYQGVTNASGVYSLTYPVAYASIPNVQLNFVTSDPRDVVIMTATSTTGFSCLVQRRVDVIGLLPTYTNRSGVTVYATVTPM